MELNKDIKVKLELDAIDVSVLIDAIMFYSDYLEDNMSLENALKDVVLRHVGKKIIDQIASEEEQQQIVEEHNDIVLQALKKEREAKG